MINSFSPVRFHSMYVVISAIWLSNPQVVTQVHAIKKPPPKEFVFKNGWPRQIRFGDPYGEARIVTLCDMSWSESSPNLPGTKSQIFFTYHLNGNYPMYQVRKKGPVIARMVLTNLKEKDCIPVVNKYYRFTTFSEDLAVMDLVDEKELPQELLPAKGNVAFPFGFQIEELQIVQFGEYDRKAREYEMLAIGVNELKMIDATGTVIQVKLGPWIYAMRMENEIVISLITARISQSK